MVTTMLKMLKALSKMSFTLAVHIRSYKTRLSNLLYTLFVITNIYLLMENYLIPFFLNSPALSVIDIQMEQKINVPLGV